MASLALGGLAACEPAPPPTAFTVVDQDDNGDARPGDGVCEATQGQGDCTLRAAIEEGNATAGRVEITLSFPSGTPVAIRDERPIVDGSTTIDGRGARIVGGLDHLSGDLVLRDLEFDTTATPSCGSAVTSLGRSVHLERVRIGEALETAVCATGVLVLTRSEIQSNGSDPVVLASGPVAVDRSSIGGGGAGLRVEGDGPFHAVNSVLPGLDAGTSRGRILLSFVSGELGDRVEAGGSLLACEPGSTIVSLGHNLDEAGACDADADGDQAVPQLPLDLLDLTRGFPVTFMPPIGAASVDAIPAGTPLLCDDSITVDQRGEPRDPSEPCDIGPTQTQVPVALGEEALRPVALGDGVHVNAQGTVAATFPGDDAGPSVGRWGADGSFTSSNDPQTGANDVDDDGTVVGYKIVDGGRRPWIWPAAGAPQVVDGLPGASAGEILLIDGGDLVGRSWIDGSPALWWRGSDGVVRPVLDSDGWTDVVALSDGNLLGARTGHGHWWPSATAWNLAAGTSTELPLDDLDVEPSTPSVLIGRSMEGDVYGVVGDGVVSWHPDGTVSRLTHAFGGRSVVFVEGRSVILTDLGCSNCTVLLVGTADAVDARGVRGIEVVAIGDDGTVVGVRDGQLVRTRLTIGG